MREIHGVVCGNSKVAVIDLADKILLGYGPESVTLTLEEARFLANCLLDAVHRIVTKVDAA